MRGLRQREEKGCAFVDLGFGPATAAVAGDDATNIGEADARPFEISRPMKSLENAEQFMGVARIEAYAVVFQLDNKFVFLLFRANGNLCDGPCARVLERIADKVHKDLTKQRGIRFDVG